MLFYDFYYKGKGVTIVEPVLEGKCQENYEILNGFVIDN